MRVNQINDHFGKYRSTGFDLIFASKEVFEAAFLSIFVKLIRVAGFTSNKIATLSQFCYLLVGGDSFGSFQENFQGVRFEAYFHPGGQARQFPCGLSWVIRANYNDGVVAGFVVGRKELLPLGGTVIYGWK